MKFREDINGLRAFAVAFVVFYHFDIPGFRGGFVGVDVFFVISGYLMSQIIFSRMAERRFSILDFYLDRARRIVPALVVMIAILLSIGWFLVPPAEYRVLGRHSASAMSFLSNILFYKETGYFDQDSREKWLLHTWSLSVEWQFYLLYPIIVVALARILPGKRVRAALSLLAVASLVTCIWITPDDPSAAFYLLPTRAWEMLVGGVVFLLPVKKSVGVWQRHVAQLVGLVIVVSGVLLIGPTAPWPGWRALIPVLGAAIVIGSNFPASFLLNNPLAQWIGRWSYSIYLWHWPIVVAFGYFELSSSAVWSIVGMVLSIILGALSYYGVEQTTRRVGRQERGRPVLQIETVIALTKIFAAMLPVMAMAVLVWRSDGYAARVSDAVRTVEQETDPDLSLRRNCFDSGDISQPCLLKGNSSTVGVILIGDSQALALAPAILHAMPERLGGALYFRAYPGCSTVIGGSNPSDAGCLQFNNTYLSRLFSDRFAGVPVVVVNAWQGAFMAAKTTFTETADGISRVVPFSAAEYRRRATDTICRIAQHHPTFVVGALPDWNFAVAQVLARRLMLRSNTPDITQTVAHHLEIHHDALALMEDFERACDVTILDPIPYLCPGGSCPGSEAGHPLYYDPRHLNDAGTTKLVPMFADAFNSVVRAESEPSQH